MQVEEIIKSQTRDYSEEKSIIEQFSSILKPYISLEKIKKRLEINGFNGVYILDKNLYNSIDRTQNTVGLYCHEEKVIIINKESYYLDKSIGIHEIGHAFLESENERKIEIDGVPILYGKGLEEGAMAILQSNKSIRNIQNINPSIYPFQSILFQQLNVLYKYSDVDGYENLLVHLFMNPKTFLSTIRDIYENIYINKLSQSNINLASKSAFAMVTGTDVLIDCSNPELYNWLNYINSLYLNVSDEQIRNGKKNDKLFLTSKDFAKTREEILFSAIFNLDIGYLERQTQNLNSALILINEILENIGNEKENNGRSKIILPR